MFFAIILFFSCNSDDSNSSSCSQVSNVSFYTNSTSIQILFDSNNGVNSFEIEYGLSGFSYGSGSKETTSNNYFEISYLSPSTTYDIYITSICSSQEHSNPKGLLSVTTDPSKCQGTPTLNVEQFSLDQIRLSYNFDGEWIESYEVEYGVAGFSLGTGTIITTESYDTSTTITQFQPDTTYDFYVRANCSESGSDFSQYAMKQHTTTSYCPKPYDLDVTYISGTSCDINDLKVFRFDWSYYSNSNIVNYTISLPDFGDAPEFGGTFDTSNNTISIQGLFCGTFDFYVRANCDDNSSSDWAGPYTF